jgi:RNase adaptor protein for sRNA GlmZ degradation
MLTVTVTSFSYIYGSHPKDESGNGGGFIFDCRALPNPGRYEQFKSLSGKDKSVILFLEKEDEVGLFLESVFKLVTQSVKKYQERDFTSLMVSFGCSGGQHRSVYSAEKLAGYLEKNFDVNIKLVHLREEIWG